jgi:hypothetical protein
MVFVPGEEFASMMAWRSVPAPEFAVLVTVSTDASFTALS